MAFKKGNKHGSGRPKGAENKETKRIREFIATLLEDNQEKFEDELLSLKGEKFVMAFSNLLEYSMPKLQRTELTTDQGNKVTAVFQIEGQEIPFEKK